MKLTIAQLKMRIVQEVSIQDTQLLAEQGFDLWPMLIVVERQM
jgi:hypothetical protein